MPASIRTTLHTAPGGPVTGPVLVDTSRDDLRKGYQLVLESVNVHTTYAWGIVFKPESPDRTDSTAALLAPEGSTSSTAKFNVDFEGPYLIRLVIDAGLPTEDTKFIRARFLTRFGNLKLVAAGERRDANGVIPLDATPEGWSNDQNQNQQLVLAQLRRQATSGRMLWVDSNKGRDAANSANDHTNTYELPGSDAAATEDEVIFTAEGHGDFATVNEAITYASAAVARGEPAPSGTNPYLIRIKPGVYIEDLVLQPHIHLIGEDWSRHPNQTAGTLAVVIRTANAGGSTHTYAPSGDTDPVYLAQIALENTIITVEPVLKHSRGFLYLDHCTVTQRGNSATQGAAIASITAGAGEEASLIISNSLIQSLANASDANWVIIVDSEATQDTLVLTRSDVEGRSVLSFNQSNYPNVLMLVEWTRLVGGLGYGIRSGGSVTLDYSSVTGGSNAKNFVIDGFLAGAGANPNDVIVSINHSSVIRVIFDDTFVGGNSTLNTGAVTTQDVPDEWLQTPGGALNTIGGTASAKSIQWHKDWRLPQNQPAGALTVPANSNYPVPDVQDVLDLLANIVNPQAALIGGAWPNTGGLTLNAAYDGVQAYIPFTAGAGLGKFILADNGAVQILGAVSPGQGIVDTALNGGLAVESGVDIGPVVGDGLGSEVFIEANPYGYGPRMSMGRAVWHNELTVALANPRPAPAAVIRGGLNAANGGYALWAMTRSSQVSGTGEQGRIIVSPGRTNAGGNGNTDAAGLYLAGGDVLEAAGTGVGGHIWMTPGFTNGGTDARLRVVCTATATPMVVLANVLYAGAGPVAARALGVSATLHLATPDEHFAIPLLAADILANVVSKINAVTLGEIVAADNGGFLELTAAKRGVNSEIFVVGATDLVGGWTSANFFTGLGDIQASVVLGVVTQGTYPDFVDMACTAAGVLTVYGTVTATIVDTYSNWVVGAPVSPLAHTGENIIGVDTTAGVGTVDLPTGGLGVGDAGLSYTIKWEAGANALTVAGNGANIDGAATVVMIALYESLTVYWGGTQWFVR